MDKLDLDRAPKRLRQLIEGISKLSPVEFAGVVRLLNIRVVELGEDGKPTENVRDFNEILGELVEKFNGLNRVKQRNLLKIIHTANKQRNDPRGGTE